MNFTGFNTFNQQPTGGTRLLSEEELGAIIKLLDTLPPGATLQSVLTTNASHPVVPILLALNPNQLQQIQQYMAARMRQLSQHFLQPQLLHQVQTQQNVQPRRIVTIQPKQSVLVPPKPNMQSNADSEDWVCAESSCRALNIGWRAACSECGASKPVVDNYAAHVGEQYNGQQINNTNSGFGEPYYNQQPYQENQYNAALIHQEPEPGPSYESGQPFDGYPLEPLGVDVVAPVDDDPNDMEVETFDNAASSILSVRKVVESPVKPRPPPRTVNARANALIPPSMPMQSQQQVSYYREPSPAPMDSQQYTQANNYYDDDQYNSPIERPPISPVLAEQEQSDGYDYNTSYHEENQNQDNNGHYQDEHKKTRKHDKDEPLVMSDRTIYVKNIVTVDEEELEKIFRKAGSIRDIRMKRDSTAPTRSAFIEYWNKEDAKVAYDTLHGVSLAGKRLQVGWAVARFSGKPLNRPSRSLFLGNLPNELTESMIRQLVAPHGSVIGVKKIYQFGEFKGCAFVDFARVEDAQRALYAVHRTIHKGKRIRADFSSTGPERGSDQIPGLDVYQDRDPRPARDSNKDPRDDYRSHRDESSSRHRYDDKPISPESRVDKTTSYQSKSTTPTKSADKAQPTSNIKESNVNTKPSMVIVSPPKPPKPKKYWKPTRNLEHYIEAIRVSKSSSGLMSTVIEKRGISYKSLNSKGDFTDIKLYLEGPKRKVDEFFNFVASCKADTVDKDVVYPIFILSRGHSDIAHLNWESPYVLGARSENVSFSGVSFKKGSSNYPNASKQAANPVVAVVVDPSEAELYRKSVPNVLLLILPESNRPISYARHVVKRMAEGADCDGTSIELPFLWLCDDNLVQFSKLEYEQGQKLKQRKTGDEMFKEAFLHAQNREDINDYGLVGFLRYDDTAVSKTIDEAKNKSSLYKCVLVNVNKTRGSNYIPGLKKFEEVAFALRLKRENVPTLKLFNYCFRAVTLQQDYNSAKERSDYTEVEALKDTSIGVDELLDSEYEPRTAAEIEDISALKEWIIKQETKGKLIIAVRPRPQKPLPQLDSNKSSSSDVKSVESSPVKPARPLKKVATAPVQQKNSIETPSNKAHSASELDTPSAVLDHEQPQDEEKEESSVIGKELVFPDVDPEELVKPLRKRQIIEDASSSSSESSESSESSDSDDSAESIEQPGTTRIKSKNVQQTKKIEPVTKETNTKQPPPVVVTTSISEAAKLREKRPSAVAAVQTITTPPKKKMPLKGAAVKAPAPPKEKKTVKPQEGTGPSTEDKSVQQRGTKRKADEMSQSESEASKVHEPVKKKSRAKPVGPDGRRHYCHQCRQPRDYKEVIYCNNSSEEGCKNNRGWCAVCLKNRYGLNMNELKGTDWSCPMCLGHCNCSTCRVLSGKKPTGALTIDTVRSLGFESVHDYLVSNDDEKVTIAIKEAAQKKKAEKKARAAPVQNNNNNIAAEISNDSTTNNNDSGNTTNVAETKTDVPVSVKQEAQVSEQSTREKRVQPTRSITIAARGRRKSPAHPIERDIEPIVIDDEGEEYSVDKIYLKRKNVNTELVQFLVKWHGFPLTVSTWVNLADMFCGDMLHDFEVAWNSKREVIEAAAKKKPKAKQLLVPSDSTDNTSTSNTNVLATTTEVAQLLLEVMDTEAVRTGTEISAPMVSSDPSAMQVDVPSVADQEVSLAQPSEQSNEMGNQTEFIQSVISTTNLSPEEALMLSEIANQVINEAVEGMAVDQPPAEQSVAESTAPSDQQSMDTEPVQHTVADQAQSVVESNVTSDDTKQAMDVVAQDTQDNPAMPEVQQGEKAQQSEESTLQSGEPSNTDNERPMETEAHQQPEQVVYEENKTTAVAADTSETAPQPMETDAQQSAHLADSDQVPTSVEKSMAETTAPTTVQETTVPSETETVVSTNAEQAPNVNNEVSTESAVDNTNANTGPVESPVVPAPSKEVTTNSSPATSPSQRFSMADLSRARSERIRKSQGEAEAGGAAPVSNEAAVTPSKESVDTQVKERQSDVNEPTSPVASNVTPVKPSSRKQTAKTPTPAKEVSNAPMTPVKLGPDDVTGETDPNEFDVGMKVWVKLTGYKWWPGQIVAKVSSDSFLVIFYSAESFKEVSLSDPDTKMVLFEGYLDILGPVTSKKALNEAVAQQHDWHLYSEDQKKKKPTKRRKKKW